MMRDVLKESLLARLRDQPASCKYPSHIVSLIGRIPAPCIDQWIGETLRKRRHPTWNQIWWELQESMATLKHLQKANLLKDRRMLKYKLLKGVPMDYIFGSVEFMGVNVAVRRPLLIPRPDTEAWLRRLLQRDIDYSRILEIGTGTGCIALALCKHLPNASIEAIDISRQAIRIAKLNHRLNGNPPNCSFRLLDAMKHPGGTYDMIISNPPYIPKADRVRRVSPSVRRWETPQALHLGQDGTAMHRHIIDMVATGHLGTKTIALELDGTSKQFSRVKGYAIEKLSGSEISALPDDHRRHRAILIEHIAIN